MQSKSNLLRYLLMEKQESFLSRPMKALLSSKATMTDLLMNFSIGWLPLFILTFLNRPVTVHQTKPSTEWSSRLKNSVREMRFSLPEWNPGWIFLSIRFLSTFLRYLWLKQESKGLNLSWFRSKSCFKSACAWVSIYWRITVTDLSWFGAVMEILTTFLSRSETMMLTTLPILRTETIQMFS